MVLKPAAGIPIDESTKALNKESKNISEFLCDRSMKGDEDVGV